MPSWISVTSSKVMYCSRPEFTLFTQPARARSPRRTLFTARTIMDGGSCVKAPRDERRERHEDRVARHLAARDLALRDDGHASGVRLHDIADELRGDFVKRPGPERLPLPVEDAGHRDLEGVRGDGRDAEDARLDPDGEVAFTERAARPLARPADDLAERDRLRRDRRFDFDAHDLHFLPELRERLPRRLDFHRVRGRHADDHRPSLPASARMCAGVVPQHPPISRTPASTRSAACSANSSADWHASGFPALGNVAIHFLVTIPRRLDKAASQGTQLIQI